MHEGHYELRYWMYFSLWSVVSFVGGLPSSGWLRSVMAVTDQQSDRQPVVVVDDLHVMYRVYAGGRAARVTRLPPDC